MYQYLISGFFKTLLIELIRMVNHKIQAVGYTVLYIIWLLPPGWAKLYLVYLMINQNLTDEMLLIGKFLNIGTNYGFFFLLNQHLDPSRGKAHISETIKPLQMNLLRLMTLKVLELEYRIFSIRLIFPLPKQRPIL